MSVIFTFCFIFTISAKSIKSIPTKTNDYSIGASELLSWVVHKNEFEQKYIPINIRYKKFERKISKKCWASKVKYVGKSSRSVTSEPCLRWKSNGWRGKHNFCRNPDQDSNGPWCFVRDQSDPYKTSWAYCDVKHC